MWRGSKSRLSGLMQRSGRYSRRRVSLSEGPENGDDCPVSCIMMKPDSAILVISKRVIGSTRMWAVAIEGGGALVSRHQRRLIGGAEGGSIESMVEQPRAMIAEVLCIPDSLCPLRLLVRRRFGFFCCSFECLCPPVWNSRQTPHDWGKAGKVIGYTSEAVPEYPPQSSRATWADWTWPAAFSLPLTARCLLWRNRRYNLLSTLYRYWYDCTLMGHTIGKRCRQ